MGTVMAPEALAVRVSVFQFLFKFNTSRRRW